MYPSRIGIRIEDDHISVAPKPFDFTFPFLLSMKQRSRYAHLAHLPQAQPRTLFESNSGGNGISFGVHTPQRAPRRENVTKGEERHDATWTSAAAATDRMAIWSCRCCYCCLRLLVLSWACVLINNLCSSNGYVYRTCRVPS